MILGTLDSKFEFESFFLNSPVFLLVPVGLFARLYKFSSMGGRLGFFNNLHSKCCYRKVKLCCFLYLCSISIENE